METPSQQQPACCTSWTSNNVRRQARWLTTPECPRQLHPALLESNEGVPWTRADMVNPESKFAGLSSGQPQVRIMPVGDRRLEEPAH